MTNGRTFADIDQEWALALADGLVEKGLHGLARSALGAGEANEPKPAAARRPPPMSASSLPERPTTKNTWAVSAVGDGQGMHKRKEMSAHLRARRVSTS